MITEFITLGGLFFWTFVGFYCLIMLATLSADDGWPGLWVTIAAVIALVLFSDAQAPNLSWFELTGLVGGYFVAGATWMVLRWHGKVRSAVEQVDRIYDGKRPSREQLEQVAACKSTTEVAKLPVADQKFYASFGGVYHSFPPSPTKHKGQLALWFFWWPFDLIAYMFENPFQWVFSTVYNFLSGFLSRMSRKAFDV